jgi:hypothetical protein
MRRIAIGLGAVAVLGVGAAIATGAIPDEDGNFYACVTKTSGTIRMIEKGATCRSSETKVSWAADQPVLDSYKATAFNDTDENDLPLVQALAQCDAGDIVTGGGFGISGGPFDQSDIAVSRSEPGEFQGRQEWAVTAFIDTVDVNLAAYAKCLDLPPAHTEE